MLGPIGFNGDHTGPAGPAKIKSMQVRRVTRHAITPVVCIAALAVVAAYSLTFIPSSVADTNLRIVLDSAKVRRLLAGQGNLDNASDAASRTKQPPIKDMLEHPEKYTAGRSQFLQTIASEPGLTLQKGTYLWTSEKSSAKCFLDAVSTAVFEKVRVVSWRNHGQEGWACGPVRPFVDVP